MKPPFVYPNLLPGLLMLIFVGLLVTACTKEDTKLVTRDTNLEVVPLSDTLPSVITQHTRLIGNHHWYIKGWMYISNEASLVMEAGTFIHVLPLEKEKSCGIIVTRGSKLIATGTPIFPVEIDLHGKGSGIILLGKAPVKKQALYDKMTWASGAKLAYGGTQAADSSGALEHVRIDYIPANKNENVFPGGLLLLGTGSATVLKEIVLQPKTNAITVTTRKLK